MVFVQPPQEETGLIEGQSPDSKEEWWVAKALWKFEIPFQYQFQIFGGFSRRGGLVVDFLVYNPEATPLLVHGEYWHKGELDGHDTFSMIAIEDEFKVEPIILWGEDAETYDDVEQFVRNNVL